MNESENVLVLLRRGLVHWSGPFFLYFPYSFSNNGENHEILRSTLFTVFYDLILCCSLVKTYRRDLKLPTNNNILPVFKRGKICGFLFIFFLSRFTRIKLFKPRKILKKFKYIKRAWP